MAFSKITTLAITKLKAGFTAFNSLIDDLLSTASGKGASQVGIQDSAGNMAAANVEDALAEIYTDVGSAQTMADILDENSATTTGLTWGFKAGLIRIDNTITTVSAGTVVLTDDDVNYVEVRKNGAVVANVTGFTVGRIPIREVTTVSGSQTVSTDKRAWFTALSDNVVVGTTITIPNTGLHILDNNATHDLIVHVDSNLSADRTLAINTGDANRSFILWENLTIADGYDISITAEDADGAIVLDNCGLEVEDTTNAGNKIKIINATSDDDKVVTLHENFTIGNGNAGTMTFTGASKTLSVEDTSVVNQDLTSDADVIFATVTVNNEGLHLLDTGGDHDLIIKSGSNLGADRILTITTGDAARTITLGRDFNNTNDTFASGTIIAAFGQNSAPTGWTKKTDWQDNAMLCYATGNIGSGGSANPQSTHTHGVGTFAIPHHKHYLDQSASTVTNGTSLRACFKASGSDNLYSYEGTAGSEGGYILYYYTETDGGGGAISGTSAANTAPHYQEVIAATKD